MTADAVLDTSRIDYLLDTSELGRARIVLVGLGSGGTVVMERLAMCGIRDWALFDPDVLQPENLVKHPARRSDLGRLKTDIATEWLMDRNPASRVDSFAHDVTGSPEIERAIAGATLVVCAVDDAVARNYVNELCVRSRVPCVFGMVFRTGLGGEVYAYLPGETGCHDCKLKFCMDRGLDLDDWLELTDEEQQRIYGLGETDFAASGLAADISIVASYHAHYVLSLLGGRRSRYLLQPSFNWLTVGIRRAEGLFGNSYDNTRILLRPLTGCHLTCGPATGPDTGSE
ncbi:ThiF family adenylyltransferase [Streptomyces sp. NPDC002740]